MILRTLSRCGRIGRQVTEQRSVSLLHQQTIFCAREAESVLLYKYSFAARQAFRATASPSVVASLGEAHRRGANLPSFRLADGFTVVSSGRFRFRRSSGTAFLARRLLAEPQESKIFVPRQHGAHLLDRGASVIEIKHCRGIKTKIKPYSSWKKRFRITASGEFQRKQKGRRHKSFSKSPKQRMRLRAVRLVHTTLVTPMRKLGYKLR